MEPVGIDVNLDFAEGYRTGRDPDRYSELLYRWHLALWSRPVPGFEPFELELLDTSWGYEFLLTAQARSFRLASDGIIATWSYGGCLDWFAPDLRAEVARDVDDFFRIASTVGGYLLFPRNGEGQSGPTINQARGTRAAIRDRIDLTLECIRRHYLEPDTENPLGDRLECYADFFALFGDFDGYVRFWLLDDLVTPDRDAVRSLMRGEVADFGTPALPTTVEEYAEYRRRSIAFVNARNERIRALAL